MPSADISNIMTTPAGCQKSINKALGSLYAFTFPFGYLQHTAHFTVELYLKKL